MKKIIIFFSTASAISNSFLCSCDDVNVWHLIVIFLPLLLLQLGKRKTYLARDERCGKTRDTSEGSLCDVLFEADAHGPFQRHLETEWPVALRCHGSGVLHYPPLFIQATSS